jgi:hypothetical protein
MEIARNMSGKYWSHSADTKRRLSKKAKDRWAKMPEKKRAAVAKRISKAKKGALSPEQVQARNAKIRAFWANMPPEEKAARIKRATRARRAAAKARAKTS